VCAPTSLIAFQQSNAIQKGKDEIEVIFIEEMQRLTALSEVFTTIFQTNSKLNIKMNCGLKPHLLSMHEICKIISNFIEITSDSLLYKKFKSIS